MLPELYTQKHSSNIMPLGAQEISCHLPRSANLKEIFRHLLKSPPPPPIPIPTAPLTPAPVAKTGQEQITETTETPPSPSSTILFLHSPQINIPILEKIPPPTEKSIQTNITENHQTQVMTRIIITTITKPDGTTSTTTETFLYPALMKDASVQTIELYEPCEYVPTKQQKKKEGKKTEQKEGKKTE